MHRKIIIEVFEKARAEEHRESGNDASTHKCAKRLSLFISNNSNIPYGERSLENAHRKALVEVEEVIIPQPEIVKALCQYLGYTSYVDYVTENVTVENEHVDENDVKKDNVEELKDEHEEIVYTSRFLKKLGKMRAVPLVSFGTIIAILIFFQIRNKQRWMIWDVDHYTEVSFDADRLQSGELKLYKEERINSFKQISVTCNTMFFTVNGSPSIYYGKNKNKELEYFSDLGKHPETGKTLKPITRYMIEKYICRKV